MKSFMVIHFWNDEKTSEKLRWEIIKIHDFLIFISKLTKFHFTIAINIVLALGLS